MAEPFKVDGVDYSPEGIESIRQEIISLRNTALQVNNFQAAVILSHNIAYLAYLKELITNGSVVQTTSSD